MSSSSLVSSPLAEAGGPGASGLWGFFGVIFGGILSASFGRVPFPGPGIKWRDQFAPAEPRRNRLWRFRRSLEPAPEASESASRESGGKASPAVQTGCPSAAEHLTQCSPRIWQTFSGQPGGGPVREVFAEPSTIGRVSRKSGVYRHRQTVDGCPETGPRFGMRCRHILCPILRSGLAIGEDVTARHGQRERPSPLGLTRAFLASMNFFHPATRAPDPDKAPLPDRGEIGLP